MHTVSIQPTLSLSRTHIYIHLHANTPEHTGTKQQMQVYPSQRRRLHQTILSDAARQARPMIVPQKKLMHDTQRSAQRTQPVAGSCVSSRGHVRFPLHDEPTPPLYLPAECREREGDGKGEMELVVGCGNVHRWPETTPSPLQSVLNKNTGKQRGWFPLGVPLSAC
ncbi:hypothetical protein K431DRAFT_25277 [Polychaeton citri CBS 116435]|uniref:Uncharacterized protein n=1 Tax=Polychaeton citri CBS 116435 TaxID=1314669 RepID=A0A9P4Q182_9PEZI|nr:hypothetical protein K431DRAFT_25277 [Polychaeton citri CBS 116435]